MVIDSQIRRAKNQMHVNRIPRTVILCVACIITIFPILWILLTSFKDTLDISAYPPAVIFSPTLKNYQRVLQIDNFGAYFKDSIIVAIASSLFATFLGSLTGYSMARFGTGGVKLYSSILFLRIFPPIAAILPLYMFLRELRVLDTYWALIAANTLFNLPLAILMMRSFFAEVPRELDEAALVDGCTLWDAFLRIALPVSIPGILATGIFCFITAWNEFLFALVLAGGNVKTIPLAASGYVAERDIFWGPMASVGVLASIPMIIFGLAIQKYLVRGWTHGAIK